MTMTMTRPYSRLADEVAERRAEQRIVDRLRISRTELLGLPYCRLCGGATSGTDDTEILCVCEQRRSQLEDRVRRLAGQLDVEPTVDITEPRRGQG